MSIDISVAFRIDCEEIQEAVAAFRDGSANARTVDRFLTSYYELSFILSGADLPPNRDEERARELIQSADRMRDDLGNEYWDLVHERWAVRHDDYQHLLCWVPTYDNLHDWANDLENDFYKRDAIYYYRQELGDRMDERQHFLIGEFDKIFHCQYQRKLDLIKEVNVERDFYPDEMWWRHPEQVEWGEDYLSRQMDDDT